MELTMPYLELLQSKQIGAVNDHIVTSNEERAIDVDLTSMDGGKSMIAYFRCVSMITNFMFSHAAILKDVQLMSPKGHT
jgi:hypothetical protein